MHKFVAIVGTNSDKSTNRKLLQFMQKHFAKQAEIELVEIKDLPLFNKPADKQIPATAQAIADQIDQADGVIISTPEYDHSAPAVLMNALEWLSYYIHPFADKPVMIIGASYGALGTSRAQEHLRQILDSPELRARIMPSSEFLLGHSLQAFDDDGNMIDQTKLAKLAGLFRDFETFVDLTKQLNHANEANRQEIRDLDWANL
ncbi:NADPH-dependent FMN reductase [Lactiplantibacillus mudanjiangensis]|uniref:NADPH-dependent FMN reductase [Lactobacillus sp.] n=1 Tax=Lactiplantibacillus mudanjiangensis TaxID=1296538 RepID=A0A660E3X5_9LACO|nr:NADPH-dependent FMN reductase [Lactiplantibacillus mudanjiangensis]VDG25359.1 NADPH-dependent FMN reductase [Lactobacillus sp.] [Lactiplantibacillus mudanjiangensis]VDG27611.1 NADPH-dependent FMN reductase [Lactobacillus sp.] [Lactiplantibacillus mudanjiangensis]VDG32961.1 NADPH-dependent FMN reductase [Lactobacillus sp.] [Lactiplantibacillus mudanjiangensis]